MKRFVKAFFNDIVHFVLFLLCVLSVIGYYTKDLNMTPFLAIMALNIIFNVNEKSLFFERIMELGQKAQYQGLLEELGLHISTFKRKKHWFEIIVISLIILGSLLMLFFVTKELIF